MHKPNRHLLSILLRTAQFALVMLAGLATILGAQKGSENPSQPGQQTSQTQGTESAKTKRTVTSVHLEAPFSQAQTCVRKVLANAAWHILALGGTPNSISATRELDLAELERDARTEIGGGKIEWKYGQATAIVTIAPAQNDSSDVHIGMRIRARGETSLRLMRPSDWWSLVSTGALEGDLSAALQARCKAGS